MGFNTRQVHAGVTPDPVTGSILTPIYQSTTFAQDSVDEYLSKGLSLHDTYRSDPLVSTAFAPHAPYTVSDGPLEKIRTYLGELDCPLLADDRAQNGGQQRRPGAGG